MVDRETGEPMNAKGTEIALPLVFGDLAGYQSPIDGSWVDGRRARRYDLEKNNCVDANELSSGEPRKLRNPRFAKKHGLEHLLER